MSSKTAEEKKLLDEKKELLANISLHGWLCKRGIKGPTADVWRKRYFKVEEGNKLMYYKTAADGPAQGLVLNINNVLSYSYFLHSYIDIDRIVSVKQIPDGQQNNNYVFHVVTEGRTYELLVHDEATMNKYVNHITVEISKQLCYIHNINRSEKTIHVKFDLILRLCNNFFSRRSLQTKFSLACSKEFHMTYKLEIVQAQ